MAEKTETDKSASPVAAPKSHLPMVIIACTVLLIATSVGITYVLVGSKAAKSDVVGKVSGSKAEAALGAEDEESPNDMVKPVALAPFVVNLSEEVGGDLHYLKVAVSLEIRGKSEADNEKLLEQKSPKFRNAVILFLSNLGMQEILGLENKKKILEHLHEEALTAFGKDKIRNLYLTELIIQ